VLPDLITAATASKDPTAALAVAILQNWDGTGDAASVGGALFEQWWDLVVADVAAGKLPADNSDNFYSPHPAFTTPWNKNNPLTTPMGLANAASLVPYLVTAYNNLQTNFSTLGGASVKWGDAHKSLLVYRDGQLQAISGLAANDSQSGADDPFGPIRVTNPVYVSYLGEYITTGGDGWVQLVEFTPQGANAQVLLDYGNSSRPNSPHVADQLPFFDSKTLRPALRTLAAVTAATVTTESY
jgi:acyl-homoserine-lactone acylase